jgi:hypothetical protein
MSHSVWQSQKQNEGCLCAGNKTQIDNRFLNDVIWKQKWMSLNLIAFKVTEFTFRNTECPKNMYTHMVNILYYNVYISFWDTLYIARHIY